MDLNFKKNFLVIFSLVLRVFLGGVFAWAGLVKLLEPAANFRAVLYSYEVIPVSFVPALAAVLPWLEWILGVFVLLGYGLRWSALGLGIFSFSLAGMIFLSGKLGLDSSQTCGCFGEGGPQLTYFQVFLLDVANGFAGVSLWKLNPRKFSLDARFLTRPQE